MRENTTTQTRVLKILGVVAVLGVVFVLGMLNGGTNSQSSSITSNEVENNTIWTCVMHLQIQRSEPGLCPICSMELVPQSESSASTDATLPQLTMNKADRKLAAIVTAPVERRYVVKTIRMTGKLDYDETRIKKISSWVDGRIERMYVDYTGIQVETGDHLVELYSPDLVTAQEELLEAKRRVESGNRDRSEFLRNSDDRTLESAREKLRLWGLTDAQVTALEKRGRAENNIVINSPQSGIVIHKALSDGEYVKTGTHIYTVADLESLWVKLDAYESDLQWLHFGQDLEIEAEAYPGDIFHGTIAFIEPTLDMRTRTVKVRVNVPNDDQRLKPGMFVRATVHAQLAEGGRVMDARLAGKWIAPMHPEIVRDTPGTCPICGMDLVTAESLGYVSADAEQFAPLIVPVTAVLRTGRRAVVYVQLPGDGDPTFQGREVTLGTRADDYYIVRAGLEEGENVVVQGNFNIDSALQIKAQPSMMSLRDENIPVVSQAFLDALTPVYESYFAAQRALSNDEFESAQATMGTLHTSLVSLEVPTEGESLIEIIQSIKPIDTTDIDSLRKSFHDMSKIVLTLQHRFGNSASTPLYEARCPMAFGSGASWLQTTRAIQNPYYGSEMFDCGTIQHEFLPQAPPVAAPTPSHQH